MGRYLNTPELADFGRFTPVDRVDRSRIAPPRVHKAERRLGPEAIAQLVADYENGLASPDLMIKYNLGKGTVLRLLRAQGVEVRNQSLTIEQIEEAIRLYLEGWSLAKVGGHFGREHTVIRDVLMRAGIPRRNAHGR